MRVMGDGGEGESGTEKERQRDGVTEPLGALINSNLPSFVFC